MPYALPLPSVDCSARFHTECLLALSRARSTRDHDRNPCTSSTDLSATGERQVDFHALRHYILTLVRISRMVESEPKILEGIMGKTNWPLIKLTFVILLLSAAFSVSAQTCVSCDHCEGYRPARIQCGGPAGGGAQGYRMCESVGDCNGCIGFSCTGSAPLASDTRRPLILIAAVVNGERYVVTHGVLQASAASAQSNPVVITRLRARNKR
jgi:hypothetical protein